MDEKTSLRYQLISAWCGPAFLVTFVVLWGIFGHNLPNPSPALTATELAARYADNLAEIRFGFIGALITVVLYLPWSAVLAAQMVRIEGRYPVLAYLQLLGGGLTVMVVSFSAFFWVAAAFRPERDPALIQLLTDLGWLCIDLQYACTTLQMVAAALVGLADKRPVPLFPRWVCFLTIWCGLSFLPASLTGVLKTGPFAWNGMLSYYIPYLCWLGWYLIASICMIKEVGRRMGNPDPLSKTDERVIGASA
ncbi:MAG: hypothetical protein M0P39_15325 [Rhodocyclaceae bacterium]|jgi:hypothetical protein|nr:hypothetical protein [Rhodocyclaceae bacterium]